MAWRPRQKLPAKGPPPLSAQEEVLAQWRGMDYGPLEKARANVAKPLGQVLARVWERRRFEQRVQESQIRQVWNQVLDPQITAHAQPVNLVRGTLFVTVDSSVWLAEIVQYRQKEILERLQHGFGREKIQRLSFRQG
ncbi:MAG: DUF721 domain-containing protein [Verrucomicrobiae bacterium]|nr:DUF721 domain-containing protein [Verrucomicrobiae bacterium]